MAGSLIKIDEEIVTSAVASVTLTGIDSTYDVYMVKYNNVETDFDYSNLLIRFTKDVSGTPTPQTTANYDYAQKFLVTSGSFGNFSNTNQTYHRILSTGTGTGEQYNSIHYLFNFNNASEYSFITDENVGIQEAGYLAGVQGGGVYTVAEAHNGVEIKFLSGNIASGTFTLYGLKK